MNIEKMSAFSLIGLMLFSECSGMDENPNFQQPDQQMQEINQEGEEENNEVGQFMEQFRRKAGELSSNVDVLTALVSFMLERAPEAQRNDAMACAEEALERVANAMKESLCQVLSVFPEELLRTLLNNSQEQSEDEQNQEAHEEEEQQADFYVQGQQSEDEQNQEAHEEEEQQLAGGNQLPAVNGGYYYPARQSGNQLPAVNGGYYYPARQSGNQLPAVNGGHYYPYTTP